MTKSYGTMSQIRERDIILKMEGISSKLVLLMKSPQKQVEFGQKKSNEEGWKQRGKSNSLFKLNQ